MERKTETRTDNQLLFHSGIWKIAACFSAAACLHEIFRTGNLQHRQLCSRIRATSEVTRLLEQRLNAIRNYKNLQGCTSVTVNLCEAKPFLGEIPRETVTDLAYTCFSSYYKKRGVILTVSQIFEKKCL